MNKIGELREIIKESNNIVFFGGAGVSTESNIPDFRSSQGLYNAKSDYGYSPEDMLSINFFLKKTSIFYDYYRKNILHTEAEPNDAHLALAKLESMGKLKAVITQNIDGLHQKAGSKEVLELHGTVYKHFCMDCQASYPLMDVVSSAGIPKCNICGGIIRPDVVLYGEALDNNVISRSIDYIERADTLIIGGTSLVVYPAAGLITYFRGKNLILINKESTPYDRKANLVINDSIGKVLKKALEAL